ncbi:MAG: MerR family transcriptional regulator [Saprospiraceae bacterium]|nr:MerR family transcriptional regulator [Saprospiraceae bacterium]
MENLSGVKAHTIRIWEKRYNIVEPKRTKTNIRYYTDEDLRHLLNVCFLYRKGYKISKIAMMEEKEIKEKISEYSNLDLTFEDELDALLLFILELDSYNFNKVLGKHIHQQGLVHTMETVIYPLLEKLNMAWLTGSFQEVHESFVTQIIKSKIHHAIENLDERADSKPSFIIYLPKGEKQELSLLYLHFLLKRNGCKVINLGLEVGFSDLKLAIEAAKPDFIFSIINEDPDMMSFEAYLHDLCEQLGDSVFAVTGYQTVAQQVIWPHNSKRLLNLGETIQFIESLNEAKV